MRSPTFLCAAGGLWPSPRCVMAMLITCRCGYQFYTRDDSIEQSRPCPCCGHQTILANAAQGSSKDIPVRPCSSPAGPVLSVSGDYRLTPWAFGPHSGRWNAVQPLQKAIAARARRRRFGLKGERHRAGLLLDSSATVLTPGWDERMVGKRPADETVGSAS